MHATSVATARPALAPAANSAPLTIVDAGYSAGIEDNDHFIERDGRVFAGSHLILDLWGAVKLDQLDVMEQALRAAVEVAGATLLHIHLHHFTPNGGISGVAVLAESHISVHTWPERDFAAFDIFMCGSAEPARAIPVLSQAFRPRRMVVSEHLRGEISDG